MCVLMLDSVSADDMCQSTSLHENGRQLSQKAAETKSGYSDGPDDSLDWAGVVPARFFFFGYGDSLMKKATKKLVIRLKELREAGDSNIFERVQVAAKILDDSSAVIEMYGDELEGRDKLFDEYFQMLAGYCTMHELLLAFGAFPSEETWKEYRYNIRAMVELAKESTKPESDETEKPDRRRATVKDLIERDDRIEDLESQLKFRDKTIEECRDEISALREKTRQLERECEHLRGVIDGLTREKERVSEFSAV